MDHNQHSKLISDLNLKLIKRTLQRIKRSCKIAWQTLAIGEIVVEDFRVGLAPVPEVHRGDRHEILGVY